jgi:hypothetical protein
MLQLNHFKTFLTAQIKSKFCSAFACLIVLGGFAGTAHAQGLHISNFVMPDTLYLNSSVPVQFSITNTLDSSILGNLQLNFRNETFNNVEAPLGGFEAVQFFAAFQERNFSTLIPVEPQYFLEGGNTVVIWPSMAGQEITSDSIRRDVYVYYVNNVASANSVLSRNYIIPNPVTNKLVVTPRNNASKPESVEILDISGKSVLQARFDANGAVNVSELPNGLYNAIIRLSDGNSHVNRMVKIIR